MGKEKQRSDQKPFAHRCAPELLVLVLLNYGEYEWSLADLPASSTNLSNSIFNW